MNITREDLELYFEGLDLPWEDYGRSEHKTVEHLVDELNAGECQINGVFRSTETVILDVFCGKEKLREACQVFADGRKRVRVLPWGSVGDKLKPGESPLFALWRALQEELGINLDRRIRFSYVGEVPLLKRSSSYPGLVTKNLHQRYVVKLPKHLYRSEGYVEKQPDKTTYFEWVPRSKE